MSIARGAMLAVAMRWTDRAIGLLSTIILARLLVPEDFGVVAMATLVIGLTSVFLDLGVNIALIQNPDATKAHYDAAWTLRVIQTLCLGLVVWFAAPFAADYFGDPRVASVVRLLALGVVIGAFENIGVIAFQKEMQFGLDFRFMFVRRVVAFLATVTAAWLMRSYWALVIGTLVGQSLGVALSYWLHPMRPRFSTEKIREILSVSQWLLVRGIGAYLDNNLHRILVGRRASAAILGAYSIADEISAMPTGELLAPLNRALFPGFVRARNEPGELKRLFLLAQGVQSLIGIPAAVGLALVANEAVPVFLGERWQAAIPFVQLLAYAGALQAITVSIGYLMLTIGAVRLTAALVWIRVAAFVAGAFWVIPQSTALDLASLRLVCMAASLLGLVWLLRTFREVRLREIVATVNRPILAVLAMAAALYWIDGAVTLGHPAMLVLKIAAGMTIYSIAVFVLWQLAGRPKGAERYVLDMAGSVLRARRTLG